MAESVFFKVQKYELQQLIRPCLQPKQPLCMCFVFVLSLLGHRSTKRTRPRTFSFPSFHHSTIQDVYNSFYSSILAGIWCISASNLYTREEIERAGFAAALLHSPTLPPSAVQ